MSTFWTKREQSSSIEHQSRSILYSGNIADEQSSRRCSLAPKHSAWRPNAASCAIRQKDAIMYSHAPADLRLSAAAMILTFGVTAAACNNSVNMVDTGLLSRCQIWTCQSHSFLVRERV